MAFNNQIEELKGQIKVLEKKLALLEQIEEHKSPVEKAYRDVYGKYPITDDMSGADIDYVSWDAFQKGYNAAYEEKVSEEPEEQKWDAVRESVRWCEKNPDKDPLDCLKPQTPEQVADGLKEAFREAIKGGIIPEVNKPTDDLIDKLTKNPPEFLKFELGQSLTDLIYDWWEDIFTVQSDMDMETSIDELVERIKQWLPKPQSAAGSQSLGVEDMVEGFNDAIKKIKRKLR
ncbi:hypothetical protein PQC13_gp109 [Synechococcus phage S-SRM01]|uniref:Uncharacterized protein n=1 Tax=Synechococcus phage S-SRM01 TaxID=2781608 RepID=A0A879R1K2_9CAUD|nr:hypothetical protein PQC13_gp109 [Synechococcus phage S-SRM01]QPX48074.1 hypothetical protein [Synechococcus phage S-SRM01]